jgi:hypothetical protein
MKNLIISIIFFSLAVGLYFLVWLVFADDHAVEQLAGALMFVLSVSSAAFAFKSRSRKERGSSIIGVVLITLDIWIAIAGLFGALLIVG